MSPGARTVTLSATVAQFSRAFAVDLGSFEATGTRYRGRAGHVHLPADLADAVEGVFGLDNRPQARPLVGHVPQLGAIAPLTPPAVAGLYGFPPGLATGQCIGLLEFGGGYLASDISAFFGDLNLPVLAITTVSVDGATNLPGASPDNDQEVTLGIDVAGSVAPGASLAVYFAPWTEQGWVNAIATAVHDTVNRPSVLSISWGWPELRTALGLTWTQAAMEAIDATLQEAAALGVTVLAAVGDHGADCGVGDGHAHAMFPASSPFVTACGGTSIWNVLAGGFTEAVWNDSSGASGGGISDVFPLPAWQAGAAVPPSLNDGAVRRGLPDIAANADPSSGYTLVVGGAPTVPLGGTSVAAPLYAGLVALMNARLGAPSGT
jgi:kumamolisin